VLFASTRISVAGFARAWITCRIVGVVLRPELVRRRARREVRGAGKQSIRGQVAVGVDNHGAHSLRPRSRLESPWQGGGREGEVGRELQLPRGLVPCGLHGNEGHARVDRERRHEVSAALLGAVDVHRRYALLATQRDIDVEGAAGGLDGSDAHQRQGPELDARRGDTLGVEGGVVEPLDHRVGVPELTRGAGSERQALERHTAGERLGAFAEEAGGDGTLGKVVKGLAIVPGHEDIDATLDRGISGQGGETEKEQTHERCQDASVSHSNPPCPEGRPVREHHIVPGPSHT
jgi:hypothetical protein